MAADAFMTAELRDVSSGSIPLRMVEASIAAMVSIRSSRHVISAESAFSSIAMRARVSKPRRSLYLLLTVSKRPVMLFRCSRTVQWVRMAS
jgi:hypothetical protein